MTSYEKRAQQLPVADSRFLWALILDMAKALDYIMSHAPEPPTPENPDANARD